MSKLSPIAVEAIHSAVEKMFIRAKSRFLGRIPPGTPKGLILSLNPNHSIASIFKLAAKTEGVKHNEDLLNAITRIGTSYLDAIKEKTKAQAVHSVQAFLTNAKNSGVDTDVETVLNGHLTDVWGSITAEVKRVVETETTTARNGSLMDAISKINLSAGIKDPYVFFVVVRDGSLCGECKRLHLMPDGVTPKIWKLSEIGAGYHKKGQSNPKIAGLHPHCRCVLTTLMPGYSFDSGGMVTYKEPGWNEYNSQRGI